MRFVYLKMLVATFLFGSYLVASKLVLKEAPVFTATLVRLVSASIVLGLYVGLRRSSGWSRPGLRDCLLLTAQSVLGVFMFSIFALWGVSMTGGIESGAILSTVPIAMGFIAIAFFGELVSVRRIWGISLSVAGAASISMLAARSAEGGNGNVLLGTVLLCCAVVCEAIFLTFGKFLSRPIPPERLSLT